jgi:asparagine synthase (glutamine-hydrolysing)
MAEVIGAEHKERLLSQEDLIRFLPEMIHLQDEPIRDPVCVPVYYVSKLARENGVVVCQVGEGSDELFCGYRMWKLKLQLQRANDWPVPPALKRVGLAGLRLLGGGRAFLTSGCGVVLLTCRFFGEVPRPLTKRKSSTFFLTHCASN